VTARQAIIENHQRSQRLYRERQHLAFPWTEIGTIASKAASFTTLMAIHGGSSMAGNAQGSAPDLGGHCLRHDQAAICRGDLPAIVSGILQLPAQFLIGEPEGGDTVVRRFCQEHNTRDVR
jgi:hypothetical protein